MFKYNCFYLLKVPDNFHCRPFPYLSPVKNPPQTYAQISVRAPFPWRVPGPERRNFPSLSGKRAKHKLKIYYWKIKGVRRGAQ